MSDRKWHLEHADGCEWTSGELDWLAVRLKEELRIAPYDAFCRCVCIDAEGEPVLLDDYGEWHFIDEDRYDVKVVCDD